MSERWGGGGLTEYEGIVLPGAQAGAAYDPASPEDVIVASLTPLHGALDAALAAGDSAGALDLAYGALASVASGLAAQGDAGETVSRVHAVAVELEPLPYEAHQDGTLAARGVRVRVAYHQWPVDAAEAAALERRMAAHWSNSAHEPAAAADDGGEA